MPEISVQCEVSLRYYDAPSREGRFRFTQAAQLHAPGSSFHLERARVGDSSPDPDLSDRAGGLRRSAEPHHAVGPRRRPGRAREVQVHGSGRLVRWLFDNHLVDEIILLRYPVVIGQGTRLFSDTGPDIALDLVDSRVTRKGVTIQVYRPTGRPQYATATM